MPEVSVVAQHIGRFGTGSQAGTVHVLGPVLGYGHYLPLLRRWLCDRLPPDRQAAGRVAEMACRLLADPLHGRDPSRRGVNPLVALRDLALAELSVAPSAEAQARRPAAPVSARVEQLVGRDQVHAYEQALAKLPRTEREVLVLRIEFAMEYLQIADETGLSEARVREVAVNGLAALVLVLAARRGAVPH
ncbi:sigma factor-like helix-turn-helix DNA-binding protein [Dokdonella koreensis]|uniref:RNA polymerase sigma factor 70 region 4 type 2 domain-containing protein n=1 Tax=Dokdonella koreensis DS-123 TaxID=1300342 RepID=A0A160DTB5_9GAMM|nr:sigma factor-like helix-turn-helix DNA-binding protein [Dokdonella koreensis]ANB16813.1 Hypothetical protein I596_777 [Dokdonella koreensis DS-123]